MSKRSSRTGMAGAILAFMLVTPGMAWALGLGQISSDTHIGEALEARIPILAADANALQGLWVGLADPAAYEQAGLRATDFLFTLKFQVEQGPQGPYVLVTSPQPVRLPFLNLLVRARWPSGEITRRYTLLLNPPVFASGGQAEQIEAPQTPPRGSASTRSGYRVESSPPARTPQRPSSATPAQQPQTGPYGPVERGQTLWGIADTMRPGTGLSMNQMMIAIYRANPQAFSGNINRLRAGAVLRMPSRDEMARVSRRAAAAQVASQTQSWRQAQATGANAAQTRPAAPAYAGRIGSSSPAETEPEASGGEVVLTAPHVSEPSETSLSGGQTEKKIASGSVEAGAVGVGAADAVEAAPTKQAETGSASGNQAVASSGGPLEVKSDELAALAAKAKLKPPPPARAIPATPAVNTQVTQATPANANGGIAGLIRDWITTPKGWIVIALIVILLALLLFALLWRRRAQAVLAADEAQPDLRQDPYDMAPSMGAMLAPAEAEAEDFAVADAEMAREASAIAALSEEPIPIEAEAAQAQQVLANALVEADFYTGHGDHAGAARVLQGVIEQAPERNDLRRRRLEELFAAGDREGFHADAIELKSRLPADSADWQAVAVMGRQLLAGEALFQEAGESHAAEGTDSEAAATEEGLDFDYELDRFVSPDAAPSYQDEFERTLGELSTMIETYMPQDEVIPGEPRPLPDDELPALSRDESEATEGDVLDFQPAEPFTNTVEVPAEPHVAKTEEKQDEPAALDPFEVEAEVEGEAEAEAEPGSGAPGMRLELAQSYVDMGDTDSARGIVAEVLDDGDEDVREQALQLLARLDADGVADAAQDGGNELESATPPIAPQAEAAEPETYGDDSGTILDLARAYLEMGDRESARDIIEEVLEGNDEAQRKAAQELLDTLNA